MHPVPGFKLIGVEGDRDEVQLPLRNRVTLVMETKILQISVIAAKLDTIERARDHESAFTVSPFRHWPGTRNRPIPLIALRDCFEMRDDAGHLIRFFTIDTGSSLPSQNLWLAHIATIQDETYHGPNPLYRLNQIQISAITTHGVGEEYQRTSETRILAYCLVLTPDATVENGYRRVGIAEVQHEWISQPPTMTISLL